MKTFYLKVILVILTVCMTVNLGAAANETIRFTWEAGITQKVFYLGSTRGEDYTVDWGDNVTETFSGSGGAIGSALPHNYAAAGTYNVVITGVNPNCLFSYLHCGNNQVTELDLSDCTGLVMLYCYENQLTDLDVSANTGLTELWCMVNELTELNVDGATALEYFYCNNNELTELDVSAHTQLIRFECWNNQITELDVSASTQLTRLECYNNQLTDLVLSGATALKFISCYNNQLTELIVSGATTLEYLYCFGNQLTELDVSANTQLGILECYNNNFPLSELFAFSELIATPGFKLLGTQNLPPIPAIGIGNELFSDQSLFKGIYTTYAVTKNGNPAPSGDYTVVDGKITFNSMGNYTVTMTNSAISSNSHYPAKVIVEVEIVNNTDIPAVIRQSNVVVYPNPTSGELQVRCYELQAGDYGIYNVTGQLVMQGKLQGETTTINAGLLANGVYCLKLPNEVVKFVKRN